MGMVWQFGILASVLVLQFAPTEGHGRLIHPQSRNLNDNGAVAGGPGAVHNYGAGEQTMYKHGVCGNAADVPQSYNKVGPIQATYESGSVAEFKVAITAHHVGYFEFELCLDAGRLSEDCFMKHRLLKEGCDDCQCEGDSTHSCADCDTCRRWWKPLLKAEMGSVVANNYTGPVLPGQGTLAPYEFVMRYAIPAGIKSRNAVLRWHYMTTNSCTSKSSAPEEFWNCADVAIKDVHGNVGGQVDFNNTHLQSMVVDNLVSDMKNGNLKGVYSTCPRNEFGLVGVAPGGEYTCGEKSGESWEDCKHLLSVPGSLADCSAPEVPLIICESQCSSTWFQCSAGVAYKQTVPDGTKCKDNYFVLAAKCTSDSDWKIPTETPQPIDSDTVSSKRCVVGENPNKQNVDDKDCAACAEGRTWWPCNVPKLCTCQSSSGVNPTPETTTTIVSVPEEPPAEPEPSPTEAPKPVEPEESEESEEPIDGGNVWTTWQGYGITFHEGSYDVSNFCPVTPLTQIGNACWKLDRAGSFKNDVLKPYCSRTDTISFGHPAAVECGECTEIRVQRQDGSYNKITVMTVDNPGSGGTTSSPELSRAGKQRLTEGTGKDVLDRLPFDWRKVSCVSDAL